MFNTKQDLFKILEFDDSMISEQSEPYEYLSKIKDPNSHDMS